MKKKLIPFILGLSMFAAVPLAAHAAPTAVDGDEGDSGLVTYPSTGNFVNVGQGVQTEGDAAPATPVITAIPECTLTIPKDTTIKKGARKADIGNITIDGKYFVKPYYVEVHATKQDFIKTDDATGNPLADPTATQDIVFDVDTEENGTGTKKFIASGTVNVTNNKSSYTPTYLCRNFWKDNTQASGSEETGYKDGEVVNIAEREHIWLKVPDAQWTDAEGGRYKGRVTFTATFRDDFQATGANATTEWASITLS